MRTRLTKVKKTVKPFLQKKTGSNRWQEVLADVKADIAQLERLVPIIERKIELGEPWPNETATHI
jgi:hypothetical protein